MKRIITLVSSFFLSSFNFVLAQGDPLSTSPGQDLDINTVQRIFSGIATWLFRLGGSIATIFIIYYAIKMMGAGGNPEKFNEAKTGLIWALVGALVFFGAGVIINSVLGFLQG